MNYREKIMKVILHITTTDEWTQARAAGSYAPESLNNEGFIHFSLASQIIGVANNYYPGQSNLLLLCIDPRYLEATLRYEPPYRRDGRKPSPTGTLSLFPHLYGPLNLDAVIMVVEFPPEPDGTFTLPRLVQDIV